MNCKFLIDNIKFHINEGRAFNTDIKIMAHSTCVPFFSQNISQLIFKWLKSLRGYCIWDLIFEDIVYIFSQKKLKQLRTKYPMDLISNVPMNLKITVLFQ